MAGGMCGWGEMRGWGHAWLGVCGWGTHVCIAGGHAYLAEHTAEACKGGGVCVVGATPHTVGKWTV